MSEIYRDTATTLTLGLAGATAVSGEIFKNGVSVYTFTGDTVALPFKVIGYDGDFTVRWTFTIDGGTEYRSESYSVVTPLISGLTTTSDKNLERTVRLLIQNYTGQVFGYNHGIHLVQGTGQKYLSLPERLISLTQITFEDGPTTPVDTTYMTITGDGWIIAAYGDGIYDIKQAPPLDGYYYNGVIYAPQTKRAWQDNRGYLIEGDWGYGSVPVAVEQAANILFEDLSGPDSEYRDRYITAITSGTWDFEYSGLAWSGTGSASADALLAPYIKTAMGLI